MPSRRSPRNVQQVDEPRESPETDDGTAGDREGRLLRRGLRLLDALQEDRKSVV
jgi:hypothetical protein